MIKYGRQRSLSLNRSHEQNGGRIRDGNNNCTRFTLISSSVCAIVGRAVFVDLPASFADLFVISFSMFSMLANLKVCLASLISGELFYVTRGCLLLLEQSLHTYNRTK